jgi:hypothetical protein
VRVGQGRASNLDRRAGLACEVRTVHEHDAALLQCLAQVGIERAGDVRRSSAEVASARKCPEVHRIDLAQWARRPDDEQPTQLRRLAVLATAVGEALRDEAREGDRRDDRRRHRRPRVERADGLLEHA